MAEIQRTKGQLRYLHQQLPKNADVYKLSGVLAHRTGQHEEAERLLRQACALNPNDPDLYGNLAIALRAQQRIHEAQRVLEDALEAVPASAVLYRNLGNVFSDQGAYAAAAASYRKSLQMRPVHRDTWMSYSFALARSGELANAVQALHEAAAQGFDECEMLRTVGQWLVAQSRGSQAVGVFARAPVRRRRGPEPVRHGARVDAGQPAERRRAVLRHGSGAGRKSCPGAQPEGVDRAQPLPAAGRAGLYRTRPGDRPASAWPEG
ncbi:hypothetical protein CKO28_23625 [Rhodovibrio sodomensis]|uniref:Tetratricopeptide repeat protein n=1 Tax=Rhodovibrio sodomensis TaxID=1088 RepID=A0ABS1DLV7_9PROT|nr:hypothetical protein [Rhodovibrio sodomensis]